MEYDHNAALKRSLRMDLSVESRASGKMPKIVGYASVFDSPSEELYEHGRTFVEIVKPGAFSAVLATNPDVRATISHGDGLAILGRTTAGTLELSEDHHGLRVTIFPPDSEVGRSVVESVRRGDLDSMSFMFHVDESGEEWDTTTDPHTRYIIQVKRLLDVTLTSYPAYEATEAMVRGKRQQSDEDLRLELELLSLSAGCEV